MPSSLLSRLNLSIFSGFERTVGGKRQTINLLLGQGKSFSRKSGLRYSTTLLPYSMAASNSKPVFGEVYVDDLITGCGNAVDFAKPTGVFFNDNSRISCRKAVVSLRRRELYSSQLSCGCLLADLTRKNCYSNLLLLGPRLRNIHTLSLACYSAGGAHDVAFDGNSRDEQNPNATNLSDQTLKLLSGSCYLPHPDKEDTGGEDAHFICTDEQAIGVADGVGGWAEVGVNAGEFSRELMANSVLAIREEPKGSVDPARVLEKAHAGATAKGSSTACIIALTEKGLHAINLGDSGFIVVRDGCTVFQSPVQQRGFNFTYQLERGSGADLPSAGQVFTISVSPGDVIVGGTDGLFDNLYSNEVTAVVLHALSAGLEPQETAQKIAALARQRALDRTRQTPFATAAQEAGFRYYGGKLDDITAVVSYVASSNGA